MDDVVKKSDRPDNTSAPKETSWHPNLKIFIAALSYAYFAKALSGSYMKSTITQLERRFDTPTYLIGIIDGSFEIGNLLVIAFVSYFGARLHRPKIIAVGCILMSFGTFLIAMPHFIIGRYKIETSVRSSLNSTKNFYPCPEISPVPTDKASILPPRGCERESSITMWIYVFLGNVLRGIGETPVQPLGISYVDDYAQPENAAFYIGCVQTMSVIGPVFGYLLGSLCAKIYVDFEYVDMGEYSDYHPLTTPAGWGRGGWVTSSPAPSRSYRPFQFWFLPKSLPVPVDKHDLSCTLEQTRFITDSPKLEHKFRQEEPPDLQQMAKGVSLGIQMYIVYLCVTILQFNSLIGMVTYKPKYIEQHYGQSASTANFLMGEQSFVYTELAFSERFAALGYRTLQNLLKDAKLCEPDGGVINIPAVALGMFSGGLVMKRYKLGIMGAAKFAFGTSLLGFFLSLFFLAMGCENSKVAGITVSYSREEGSSYREPSLFSDCNSGCLCSRWEWDPVCGENGITYASPCLAGCVSSTGSGRRQPGNLTATPGRCPGRESCDRIFPYFMALSVLSSFIISLGGTPGFMVLSQLEFRRRYISEPSLTPLA
ncbi:hypothetical protein fugu_011538 [Takifugu bimaculatus]|uniref:Solute carrier organic anion transporter family member 1C1 n=1 Tax=Takifugu bimaculatus TaxID=433685 RepID=A0A4Z2C7U7_9TELE|nr:hypothetical protein fugu_011538 [Takifugu bimaculatus]